MELVRYLNPLTRRVNLIKCSPEEGEHEADVQAVKSQRRVRIIRQSKLGLGFSPHTSESVMISVRVCEEQKAGYQ